MSIIQTNVQSAVDEYLMLHEQAKQLDKRLKELRGVIEPFMTRHQLDVMTGTNAGSLVQQVSYRTPLTNRYTAYDYSVVEPHLSKSLLRKVAVEVIDKDLLEMAVKVDEAPINVLDLKITTKSTSLTVKR